MEKLILTSITKDELEQLIIDCVTKCLYYKAKSQKTTVNEFIREHDLSVRLKNVLRDNAFVYIDDITKKDFYRCNNAGKESWIEFVSIRGYE